MYSRCHSATLSISVYNTATDLATHMWVMSTLFVRVCAMYVSTFFSVSVPTDVTAHEVQVTRVT